MTKDHDSSLARRLGLPKSLLLVLAGGLVALVGAATCVLLVGLLVRAWFSGSPPGSRAVKGSGAIVFVALLFGALSAWGIVGLVRGIRGLDPKSSPPTDRGELWFQRHWYGTGLAAWFGVSLLAVSEAPTPRAFLMDPSHWGRWPWFVFLALLVLPLHVAVHELGHATAGALVGFRIQSLRVGWLTLFRDDRGFRLRWDRPAAADLLGFHAALPIEEVALGLRRAVHAAAGPAASLAAAMTCRLGLQAISPGDGVGSAVMAHLLWAGFLVGAFLGVVNLLPFRTRSGRASDGAIIVRAFRRETPAEAALRRFHTQSALGRRPRDWGMTVSDVLGAVGNAGTDRASIYIAAAAVALDSGGDHMAAHILAQSLAAPDLGDVPMRFELELQLVMLDAFSGRVAAARSRLEGLPPHVSLPDYPKLALAVVVAAEGFAEPARVLLAKWEHGLEATGRASVIRVGNEWAVERLQERLRATESSVAVDFATARRRPPPWPC